MFDYIKELPTKTRKQRILKTLLLLIAAFSVAWGLRSAVTLFRDSDWRIIKPYFYEGRIENGRYINDSIGWEIVIPEGWELSYTRSASENRHATDMLKKQGVEESVISGVKELVAFQKGQQNKFVSSVEHANGMSEGDVVQNMIDVSYVMKNAFAELDAEFSFDYPAREVIGGQVFYVTTSEIIMPDNKTTLWMISYGGVVGDRYLSVIVSYTDPKYKSEMLEAWRGSVFKSS